LKTRVICDAKNLSFSLNNPVNMYVAWNNTEKKPVDESFIDVDDVMTILRLDSKQNSKLAE